MLSQQFKEQGQLKQPQPMPQPIIAPQGKQNEASEIHLSATPSVDPDSCCNLVFMFFICGGNSVHIIENKLTDASHNEILDEEGSRV